MSLRPMLATAMVEDLRGAEFDKRFGTGWTLEEKLDGHRCLVQVRGSSVVASSRPRSSREAGKPRILPPAMAEQLGRMGEGDYDGELVAATGKSWDVVTRGAQLVFVTFDLLTFQGLDVTSAPYDARRAALLDILRRLPATQSVVSTVTSLRPRWADVEAIWSRGGEGAILKRIDSRYQAGVRSPDWLKVKTVHHTTMTIIGFEAGRSGPYSALRLRDDQGHVTTVKTPGHRLLAEITAAPAQFLEQRVVITYQERTPAGFYRHGRFDHFTEVVPFTKEQR